MVWRKRLSPAGNLVIACVLLTGAFASISYGLIGWHAIAFAMDGVWFYDNEWRPHPMHFIALGIGLAGPLLWDVLTLALAAGERQGDATKRAPLAKQLSPRTAPAAARPVDAAATAGAALDAAPAEAAASAPRTFFRPIRAADRNALLALAEESRALHAPWIDPPRTAHAFKVYLRRTERDDHAGYAICRRDGGEIVGVVNMNNIQGGTLRSASIAYYVGARHARKGYMREGLRQVKAHAFTALGLHRLEANIRPGNTASIALVRGCGFIREGVSARYLFVDGAWRDHERWAVIDRRETLL